MSLPSVVAMRIVVKVPTELAPGPDQAQAAALIFASYAARIGFPRVEASKAVDGGHVFAIVETVDPNRRAGARVR